MRFTIIRDTNFVSVDGVGLEVDCSSLPATVHAVQWDGVNMVGEVEHCVTRCDHCGVRSKKGNEFFTDPAPYQPLLDAWHAAEAVAEKAKAAALEKAGVNAAGG